MSRRIAIAACFGAILLPGLAPALEATAGTDLLLRVGPGAGGRVVDSVPAGERVVVHGCVESTGLCLVHSGGQRGWVAGAALADEGVVRSRGAEPSQAIALPPPVIVVVEQGDPGFATDGIVGVAPVVRVRRHHDRRWRHDYRRWHRRHAHRGRHGRR